MKRFMQAHYDEVFKKAQEGKSDMDIVENFLKSKGIPYHQTSSNGITPSLVINFGDCGEREDVETNKKPKNRRTNKVV